MNLTDESTETKFISPNHTNKMSQLKDIFDDYTLKDKLKLVQFPWNHPDVLQFDKTYIVLRQNAIPPLLLETINSCDRPEDVFAYASCNAHYAVMASKSLVSIYLKVDPKTYDEIILKPPPSCQSSPFVIMIPAHTDTSSAKLFVIDINGNASLWSNIKSAAPFSNPCCTHKMPLETQSHITSICLLSHNQIVVGTSSGRVILLAIQSNQSTVDFSIKSSHKGSAFSNILENWLPSAITRVRGTHGCKDNLPVLRLVKTESMNADTCFMTLNDGMLQKWAVSANGDPKLLFKLDVVPAVKQYISKNILKRPSDEDVKIHIIDMDRYNPGTSALLVSYHVPEMDNCTQFAVILLYISTISSLVEGYQLTEKEYKINHIVTLPYSTIMSSKKRKPTIRVSGTGPIAFVTFDDSVISICIDQHTIFESTIGLKPELGDMFLYTTVQDTNREKSDEDDASVATILTAMGKVLEFKVDHKAIKDKKSNEVFDNTKFLEKRLLQAAAFQDKANNPLSFPISTRPMRGNIGKAALSATHSVFVGDCFFTGPKMNFTPFFSLRLQFIMNIADALKKEDLFSQIDRTTRKKLLAYTEASIVADEIWKQYTNQKKKSAHFFEYTAIIEKVFLGLSPSKHMLTLQDNERILADSLSKHCIFPTQFFEAFANIQESLYFTSPMKMQGFRIRANELILSIRHAYRKFETRLKDYNLPDVNKVWTLKWRKLLKSSFEKTYAFHSINQSYTDNFVDEKNTLNEHITLNLPVNMESDLGKQLCDLGQELLNLDISEEDSSAVDKTVHQIQGFVIETIFKTGYKQLAIEMAEKSKHFSALLEITQSEEGTEAEKLRETYLCRYGNEFVYSLCKWYCDHNQEGKILKLKPSYFQPITEFFQENKVPIAWIHYMRVCDYKNMFGALQEVLRTEHEPSKRKALLGYSRLAYMSANGEGPDSLPLNKLLESKEMKRITKELESIKEDETDLYSKFLKNKQIK
ncbi:hypothetical protein J3Q64DRAFT_1845460 [Phycomyces blakesleeanus]|uniref:Nucleoporin Nup133/Nup155-like N-terminal domain-containing protein n=1 Tax=Phycomyces blakesleeanus TaxID=4837 RepID=A0ABR3BJ88_PHYBL